MDQITDAVNDYEPDVLLFVECPSYNISPLVGSVFTQNQELDVVIFLVSRQSCQFKDSMKHFVAMALALFCVDV